MIHLHCYFASNVHHTPFENTTGQSQTPKNTVLAFRNSTAENQNRTTACNPTIHPTTQPHTPLFSISCSSFPPPLLCFQQQPRTTMLRAASAGLRRATAVRPLGASVCLCLRFCARVCVCLCVCVFVGVSVSVTAHPLLFLPLASPRLLASFVARITA